MTEEEAIQRINEFAYRDGTLRIEQRDYDKLIEHAGDFAPYANETMTIVQNPDGILVRLQNSKKAKLIVSNGHLELFYFHAFEQGKTIDPFPESFRKLQNSQ